MTDCALRQIWKDSNKNGEQQEMRMYRQKSGERKDKEKDVR